MLVINQLTYLTLCFTTSNGFIFYKQSENKTGDKSSPEDLSPSKNSN